ncbi:unnamed protein product [Chondrus crispus]|uniref:DDE Tnp4 domain-containing protein n=1 Tax=Chondrus crispus TaxID=2769 RepID=R7QFZ6_CHOCR|nr:unnamed protein product [Chondrus crispus]CDF36381.1 unnamed protein product [Chondrus crispus]|eukprot:XP_005716200.1 unnamed protein product [Chondrus crispus]
MSRAVYEEVRDAVLQADDYFVQSRDATGRLGATLDQKIMSALRQLTCGISADAVTEIVGLMESSNAVCLKRFCEAIVDTYDAEWLRSPDEHEIQEIEAAYKTLGFPGCLDCLDCASWEWDKCPVGWQGMYKGKDKKPVCRMEVICDDRLYIWHVMFGSPGSKNDINIMHQSPLFNSIRTGAWPPIRPETEVAGMKLDWYYYFTDGIYPQYRILMSSISEPVTKKEKLYSSYQEGTRKAVERVFGVLFQRFRLLYQPSRLWYKEDMNSIVRACCILHNNIVKSRLHTYNGTAALRFTDEETTLPSDIQIVSTGEGTYEQATFWRKYIDPIEKTTEHVKLKNALAEHIWNQDGDESDSSQ